MGEIRDRAKIAEENVLTGKCPPARNFDGQCIGNI